MPNDIDAIQLPSASRTARFEQTMAQLQALIAAQTTAMVPASQNIPAEIYTDPARWDAEKREIFQRLPLLAALSVDLPNPGDMLVFDAAGPSIVLTRGKSGKVHAFLNMCTHRGAKLVLECKNASRIVCPYHAWTFQLDGTLAGVPRREAFDPAEIAKRNLIKVPVGEWGGMIFVKASPGDEEIDVEAWLGIAAQPVAMLDLGNIQRVDAETVDIAANWKAIMDTYCEGYHLAALHKDTIANMFVSDVNVHNVYGDHRDFCYALHEPGTAAGRPGDDVKNYVNITCIFPNTVIADVPVNPAVPAQRLYNFQRTFPGDNIFATKILADTFDASNAQTPEEKAHLAGLHRYLVDVVSKEDFPTAAGVSDNMQFAPPEFSVIFGRNEQAVQGMHEAFARAIGMRLSK